MEDARIAEIQKKIADSLVLPVHFPDFSIEGELVRWSNSSAGTGFFITNNGYFVTAKHVARYGKKSEVKRSNKRENLCALYRDRLRKITEIDTSEIEEQIGAEDDYYDVALFKMELDEEEESSCLELGNIEICECEDEVFVIGFAGGWNSELYPKLAMNVVYPEIPLQGDTLVIRATCLSIYISLITDFHVVVGKSTDKDINWSGISGAPVYHIKSGKVIGVISASYSAEPWKGCHRSMRVDILKQFIENNCKTL